MTEIVAIASRAHRRKPRDDERAAGLLVRPQARRLSADSVRVHRLRERDLAVGLGKPRRPTARLMRFVSSRPLVGYYLEFDVAMINRVIFPMLGMGLPQPRDRGVGDVLRVAQSSPQPPTRKSASIDLRFDHHHERARPCRRWEAHDALNDAVMAGLAFVKLRGLVGR